MGVLRHPALRWLKKNDLNKIPTIYPTTEQRMAAAYEFEVFAKTMFPKAVRQVWTYVRSIRQCFSRKAEAWKNGSRPISPGKYRFGKVTCLMDVLEAFVI